MAAYLDKAKITSNGRISLGTAAMRNLKLQEGDMLEIFFDEGEMSLIVKKSAQESDSVSVANKQVRGRKKNHGV